MRQISPGSGKCIAAGLGIYRSRHSWPLRDLLGPRARDPAPVHYVTAPVTRGNLEVTAIATGTVPPGIWGAMSSELFGRFAAVEADFHPTVASGKVLARLHCTRLNAQLLNSEAQLTASRTRLVSAQATVIRTADWFDTAEALDLRGSARFATHRRLRGL